ncbi:hypothetical protein SMALA_5443 [Streptomyces malaysiensis subsp. malaysiensis]|nr:hypothetical protein SMALA_5443 [Streptomyces malaysiensis]
MAQGQRGDGISTALPHLARPDRRDGE